MTTLKNLIFPDQKDLIRKMWDLEAENFAWIDFFWSTLGRSGEFGQDVEIIYDKMQDEAQFRKLVENLATGLAAQYGISDTELFGWLRDTITKKIVDFIVHKLVYSERKTDQLLSEDAKTGLQDFVNGPLKMQLEEEWQKRQHLYFPDEITFVFGHTHKPFEEPWTFTNVGNGVPVYNTGGWVVETVDPTPVHGGAALLLNENLDVVSLRMYNEADGPVDSPVKVEVHEQPLPGQGHSGFFTHLDGLVQANQPLWNKFSQTVPDELGHRRKILEEKINS
jgi:hypothetical protein